jgi:polyhydroxybutyrate depolymerase
MDFDGSTRTYILAKPKQYDATKKYPLVFNLHGNPGDAAGEAAILPFDQVSNQDAVIVYPLAADGAEWDWSDNSEDIKWFKPLVAEVAKKASIDTTRVLGFGYSGGAYFLSQYACKVGGVLKAAAILSGGAPEIDNNGFVDCPSGKLPIILMHGKDDNTEVPFDGGDYAQQCWAHNNRCTDGSLADWGMDAPCQKYSGCDDNPVVWCAVPNQGHNPWVPGMQAAWDFFKALP